MTRSVLTKHLQVVNTILHCCSNIQVLLRSNVADIALHEYLSWSQAKDHIGLQSTAIRSWAQV